MTLLKTVTPAQLHDWLEKKEAVVIDVREPYENEARRIPGSTLVSIGTARDFPLETLRGKKIVVHCQLGKRGSMACEFFTEKYPDMEIYNLEGGLIAWENAGFEVASGKP